MMSGKEIIEFIKKHGEEALFGVNEDGLTLSELKHPDESLEVGGLPEHFYPLKTTAFTCPHCGAKTDHECLTPTTELHECKHCEEQFYYHTN